MNSIILVELLILHLQYKDDNIRRNNFVAIIMFFISFKD